MGETSSAKAAKSQHGDWYTLLLLVQGLADEEYELSDEDEDGSELDDEDEEPILVNGSAGTKPNNTSVANGSAAPAYGYRDVFGKDSAKRRQQLIDLKVGVCHHA